MNAQPSHEIGTKIGDFLQKEIEVAIQFFGLKLELETATNSQNERLLI